MHAGQVCCQGARMAEGEGQEQTLDDETLEAALLEAEAAARTEPPAGESAAPRAVALLPAG
eukprot:7294498-Alexandrium_andersonii.AAC.1